MLLSESTAMENEAFMSTALQAEAVLTEYDDVICINVVDEYPDQMNSTNDIQKYHYIKWKTADHGFDIEALANDISILVNGELFTEVMFYLFISNYMYSVLCNIEHTRVVPFLRSLWDIGPQCP